MEANLFPENDRKVFRFSAPVGVSFPKIRMDKDQRPKWPACLKKPPRIIRRKSYPASPEVREEITYQLFKER